MIQQLESRRHLSAVLKPNGVLIVTGTEGADVIELVRGGAALDQVEVRLNAESLGLFPMLQIKRFSVGGLGGNDLVEIRQSSKRGDVRVRGLDTIPSWVEGSGGDDTLVGGGASDTLVGGNGRDRLIGGSGRDVVSGGANGDTLFGDTAVSVSSHIVPSAAEYWDNVVAVKGIRDPDQLFGGGGNDRFHAGGGSDVFFGGAGTDVIDYSDQQHNVTVTLDGVANDGYALLVDVTGELSPGVMCTGNCGPHYVTEPQVQNVLADVENVIGGLGRNRLTGSDAANILYPGPGINELDGGGGADLLFAGGSNCTLDGGYGDDTLMGGAEVDVLHGGAGNDRLLGFASNDVLIGGPGNDWMEGGDGDDVLSDGETYIPHRAEYGNDTLFGGSGADLLDGSLGTDLISGGDADGNDDSAGDEVTYESHTQPLQLSLDEIANDGAAGENDNILSNIERVTGGAGADRIVGNDAPNSLYGGDGMDTIYGQGGNDTVVGGAGNNDLHGGAGDDTLWGVFRTRSRNRLYGDDGNDTLNYGYRSWGGAGNDTILGTWGSDTIDAGPGDDRIDVVGNSYADSVDGGDGLDAILGNANDTFVNIEATTW